MSKLISALLLSMAAGSVSAQTFEWRPQLLGHGLPPLVRGPLPSQGRPFDRSTSVQYPASNVCYENLRDPEMSVCEEREASEWIGLRVTRNGDICKLIEQARVPTDLDRVVFSTITTVIACLELEAPP